MQKTRNFNKLNIFLHCLALVRGQAAERTYIAEYTYDENGIKTSVNAEGKTTYFIYEGNTLLGQYTDNDGTIENAMQFLYDENGEIQGVQHNGRMYYYQKDIMGNVYTVRNASGGSSGAYKYEAYGHNFFGYDGNDPFRNINPIKYRGYYYDSYYGGYYNLSRYYNPGMGRFLNLDDPMIALQSKSDPDGMNLYTYCNNDPVNYVDYDGYKKSIKPVRDTIYAAAKQYLSKRGYTATLALFYHFIYGDGRKITSYIEYELINGIKKSDEFKKEVKKKVLIFMNYNQKNLKFEFKNGDMHYALQHITYSMKGGRTIRGKWTLEIKVRDTFDFDQIRTFSKGIKTSNLANDLGYVMQKLKLGKKFKIEVTFNYTFNIFK